MTGSLGYTISELDVEKGGSADSKAFTLAGYVKRDVKLTDTVKLEPNVSFHLSMTILCRIKQKWEKE